MKDVKIIVDPGSCHYNNTYVAYNLIKKAAESGADAIKFQLFDSIPPNIPFDYTLFEILYIWAEKFNIEMFASVWDIKGVEFLHRLGCKSIKFAFAQNRSPLIDHAVSMGFENVYVSYPLEAKQLEKDNWKCSQIKPLYCVPEYPVQGYLNFEKIFDGPFVGFSDHTIGIEQTLSAVRHGAKVIEKHFQLPYLEKYGISPDSIFAIMPKELKTLIKTIKLIKDLDT